MYKLDLKIKELLEILETYSVGVDGRTKNRKVNLCMDSREPAKGVVFWPIKGARFDAHQFVTQMEKNGALMSVVNADAEGIENFKMYAPVDDTTKALLKLAKGYQKNFKVKKVAITGSNGKTTTKEMVKAVLSQKYNTHATAGNFNNHIGVPMTLFQLKHSHEAAVIEMGTSGPDEIRPLSLAVEPDVAVITNIGASHLERLKDLDGVFAEKKTIVAGLKKNGVLIVNADDPRLCKCRSNTSYKVITFGVKRGIIKPEKLEWCYRRWLAVQSAQGRHRQGSCQLPFDQHAHGNQERQRLQDCVGLLQCKPLFDQDGFADHRQYEGEPPHCHFGRYAGTRRSD